MSPLPSLPLRTSTLISLTTLAFCIGVAPTARAWNAVGHHLVAAIAWDEMTAEARDEATRLLRRHPDYPRWLEHAGKKESERDRRIFIEASTWPDKIRKDERFYSANKGEPTPTLPGFPDMERRSDWHAVSIPLNGNFDDEPLSGQLRQRLPELLQTLGERIPGAADSNKEMARSYALPWLIHLAGDSHQPLHTSARLNVAGGYWDRLGQKLKVHNPFNPRKPVSTLHDFWDDLPGSLRLRSDPFDAAAQTLAAKYARVDRSVDSKRWIKESWQLAKEKAYPPTPDSPSPTATAAGKSESPSGSPSESSITITETFYQASREIADRRIAQAGFRLAAVLNASLTAKPPTARPTQNHGRQGH